MSDTIKIDNVDYKKLEIVSMTINGEEKSIVTAEDTQNNGNISMNITVNPT